MHFNIFKSFLNCCALMKLQLDNYLPIDYEICDRNVVLVHVMTEFFPITFGNCDKNLDLYIMIASSPLLV
jgi:hypothetical protein